MPEEVALGSLGRPQGEPWEAQNLVKPMRNQGFRGNGDFTADPIRTGSLCSWGMSVIGNRVKSCKNRVKIV